MYLGASNQYSLSCNFPPSTLVRKYYILIHILQFCRRCNVKSGSGVLACKGYFVGSLCKPLPRSILGYDYTHPQGARRNTPHTIRQHKPTLFKGYRGSHECPLKLCKQNKTLVDALFVRGNCKPMDTIQRGPWPPMRRHKTKR